MASTRIPPLLSTYLSQLPKSSLVLLTSVLNATANWLVLRFLAAVLNLPPVHVTEDGTGTRVVLVSFLRDWEFWRDGARRLGIDFVKLSRERRIVFVDGLTGLFGAGGCGGAAAIENDGKVVLRDSRLEAIEKKVLDCLRVEGQSSLERTVLILDGLDLLLSATEADALAVGDIVAEWRERAYSTILSVSSDSPLMRLQDTPLEVNHAAFVSALAYQARFVMSLRLLSTGVAKDVSGVLRITRGPGLADEEGEAGEEGTEMEVLYFVGGDGGVKVFERGADG